MRRLIDVLFAALVLILTLPSIFLIAILIRIDSPGPVFYQQGMVGWKGKVFSLLRFRTMYAHSTSARAERGFTRIGRFLRDISLDHLPQLFNLLKGDLTLIGPRPMEVDVVDLQDSVWKRYVQVQLGLFNYAVYKLGKQWTPSRATDPDLNQKLELDYMQKRSAISDLQLLLQFLRKLVASRGNIKERGDVDEDAERKQLL